MQQTVIPAAVLTHAIIDKISLLFTLTKFTIYISSNNCTSFSSMLYVLSICHSPFATCCPKNQDKTPGVKCNSQASFKSKGHRSSRQDQL